MPGTRCRGLVALPDPQLYLSPHKEERTGTAKRWKRKGEWKGR